MSSLFWSPKFWRGAGGLKPPQPASLRRALQGERVSFILSCQMIFTINRVNTHTHSILGNHNEFKVFLSFQVLEFKTSTPVLGPILRYFWVPFTLTCLISLDWFKFVQIVMNWSKFIQTCPKLFNLPCPPL